MQRPTNVKWLENVALRDLVLHEHHAACVDGRGNVYQWGDGFFGSVATETKKPKATMCGKVGAPLTSGDLVSSRLDRTS